jgi:hypothetical protein
MLEEAVACVMLRGSVVIGMSTFESRVEGFRV